MNTKGNAGAAAHAVRARLIEALARRAESHTGEARRRLDERVAALRAAHGESMAGAAETTPAVSATAAAAMGTQTATSSRRGTHAASKAPAAPPRTPLAELVAALARDAGREEEAAPRATPAPAGALSELKSVRRFNATWTRLAADHRLAQSLEQVPANAGPLNSQHLVHQALALMREASPAYLDRFIAQVDALLWLEQQASTAGKPAATPRSRA